MEELKIHDCVGCGYCCNKAPCTLASTILSAITQTHFSGSCPFQVEVKDKHRCLLAMTSNERLNEMVKRDLAMGEGCCSPLNSDRRRVSREVVDLGKEKWDRQIDDIEQKLAMLSNIYGPAPLSIRNKREHLIFLKAQFMRIMS